MEYKKIYLLILLAGILVISCGSKPDNTQLHLAEVIEAEVIEIVHEEPDAAEEEFDPATITQEYYLAIREEVRRFIEGLNYIIRNRNYTAWRAALSTEYFEAIASDANLKQLSALPAMRTRRIVLTTPEDYFTHVVVPSRANSRVDDIEFVSTYRVKAFTVTTNRAGEEQRLRLYDLEKIENRWTIIN